MKKRIKEITIGVQFILLIISALQTREAMDLVVRATEAAKTWKAAHDDAQADFMECSKIAQECLTEKQASLIWKEKKGWTVDVPM